MGSNRCRCGHLFFAHGPDGCRTCGCTATRGGLFRPDTRAEEIVRLLRVDPSTMKWGNELPYEDLSDDLATGEPSPPEDVAG